MRLLNFSANRVKYIDLYKCKNNISPELLNTNPAFLKPVPCNDNNFTDNAFVEFKVRSKTFNAPKFLACLSTACIAAIGVIGGQCWHGHSTKVNREKLGNEFQKCVGKGTALAIDAESSAEYCMEKALSHSRIKLK